MTEGEHVTLQQHVEPRLEDGAPHVVHFYSDPESLADRLSDYVAEGIAARQACVVISTEARRTALVRRLAAAGVEPSAAQLVLLDAAATLQGFMRSGRPDAELFDSTVGRTVRSLAEAPGGVRAYGEMVGLLWAYGNAVGALHLEDLWNDLQRAVAFPLLCAYASGDLHAADVDGDGMTQICVRHTERSWY